MSGNDTSTGSTQAQLIFNLSQVSGGVHYHTPSPFGWWGTGLYGISLSAPLYLEFNIYVPASSYTSHFSVDAVMSDGRQLSGELDGFGHPVYDMHQLPCYASGMSFTIAAWVQEECDLSELRFVNITDFLLVYDNGGHGNGGGHFEAFFENIRVVNAVLPGGISNGGFEVETSADGWIGGGGATVVRNPPPQLPSAYRGAYALIGTMSPSLCSAAHITCPTTSRLQQVMRIPNAYLAPRVSHQDQALWITGNFFLPVGKCGNPGTCGTSNSFFRVYLMDRTALRDQNVVSYSAKQEAMNPNRTVWQSFMLNVTPFEGDLVWLTLEVISGMYQDENGVWWNDYEWAAFDNVTFTQNPFYDTSQGAFTRSDTGVGGPGTINASLRYIPVTCSIPGAYYVGMPHSWGSAIIAGIPNDGWYGRNSQWPTPITAGVSFGLDLAYYSEDCNSNAMWLYFTVHAHANATGYVTPIRAFPNDCGPTTACATYATLWKTSLTIGYSKNGGGDSWQSKGVSALNPDTLSGPTLSVQNLSVYNPTSFLAANYELEMAIVDVAAFISLAFLSPFGLGELELPLVFENLASGVMGGLLGNIMHFVAMGALSYLSGGNPSSGGSTCGVAGTVMTCNLAATSLVTTDAAATLPLYAFVGGSSTVINGGHYHITATFSSYYYLYYLGSPVLYPNYNPPSPYGPVTTAVNLDLVTCASGSSLCTP